MNKNHNVSSSSSSSNYDMEKEDDMEDVQCLQYKIILLGKLS
jgi:hypothetical protein